LKTGDNEIVKGDPLLALEAELKQIEYVPVAGLPLFTGM